MCESTVFNERRWWSRPISIFKMIANWRARYLDTILESVRSTCSHMCQWKQRGEARLLNKSWQAKKKKCFDYGYVYNFAKKSERGDLAPPPSLRFQRLCVYNDVCLKYIVSEHFEKKNNPNWICYTSIVRGFINALCCLFLLMELLFMFTNLMNFENYFLIIL